MIIRSIPLGVFLLSIVSLGTASVRAQDFASIPTKLLLTAQSRFVKQDQAVELKVDLCNAANQPVSAQGDVVIQITSDQGTSQSATLHSGDKSVELQFTFSSPGIARVTASETHLLSGSTLMRVLPKSSPATQPALENGSGRRTISTALPQLGSV